MHNSLHIRELLKTANADPLCVERRNPHRLVEYDPAARPQSGDVTIRDGWSVACDWPDARVSALVCDDLADFLAHLGVKAGSGGQPQIMLRYADADLRPRDFRWNCNPQGVAVEAGGAAGLWAAVAWLEFEMRTRRGPFLPSGVYERRAAWEHQISQGPWGGNYSVPDFSPAYLSDDSFWLYAHYGVNEMMIYGDLLCYAESVILPELNYPEAGRNLEVLRDCAQRAALYGVRLSYVPVGPKLLLEHPVFAANPEVGGIVIERKGTPYPLLRFLCTESAAVRGFYREQFSRLFSAVPELAGLILIVAQESFYHCKMWWGMQRVKCPRCEPLSTETVLAHILDDIRGAVQAANSSAFVAAWPYATQGWERPDRLEFIRRLPAGTAFMISVDKEPAYRKDRYIKNVWDYSIDHVGPSAAAKSCAALCRASGRPLLVKTETGIGLEVIQFPYVPAMQRLAGKWEGVRSLQPAGVHQSWLFFGMFNSRAEALGLWAAYAAEMPAESYLLRLAVRDMGPGAAELVVEAWRNMSAAMGHLPVLLFNYYYVGPSFLGPCHPLLPAPGMALSPVFDGCLFYLQEAAETFGKQHIEHARTCLAINAIHPMGGLPRPLPRQTRTPAEILRDEYGLAARYARRALECLDRAAPLAATAADRQHLREETLLTEAVYRTNRACWNAARWLLARDAGDTPAMRAAALDERENARAAVPMYAAAPWLDFNRRLDGKFSAAVDMIEEKARMLDRWLQANA